MTQKEFDKLMEGVLIAPERVKLLVKEDYDLLMSSENTNNTVDWFKVNASILEDGIKKMNRQWLYIIETCPDRRPFIYMFIFSLGEPKTLSQEIAEIKKTLPTDRQMVMTNTPFEMCEIDKYDNTPVPLLHQLLTEKASDVLEVLEP